MSLTSKVLIGVSVLCFLVFFTASCTAPRRADRNGPLLGTWKTERGLIITVQMTEEKGAEASIKLAPGFIGDDFKIGKVIITSIKPAPGGGWMGLFIMPGYDFKAVDAMITNFHLPRSTLLALVAAFAGFENIMAAYRHAIEQRYRFYSYGDAMLIS